MGEMKEGLVIKGIGGFYYVQCGDVLHACRARGKFRKDKISPYAGDRVRIEVDANDEGYVQEILPRKNFLVRPPLANLDKLFVVSSVREPPASARAGNQPRIRPLFPQRAFKPGGQAGA